jgi:mRNA interferase YafQ
MRTASFSKSFQKDIKLAEKRHKDLSKLKTLISEILSGKPLDEKYKTHMLKGNYAHYWDSHIEPDWLLIYKIVGDEVIFARTGTHADLF